MHIYYKFCAAECKLQSSPNVFVMMIKTKENQLYFNNWVEAGREPEDVPSLLGCIKCHEIKNSPVF